ncbi:class I adenylate-forming enzyme family protein [Ottowia sp. VDI28]|uniref:class I adenylate-forming enzyme family protein n=1 Tax=Ottowia sp. VDI28 TaxID=3133968 RepID=UPI003C2BAF15
MAESFYGDTEASQEAFRDGWFYPGDLGEMNDEGYLFLKGRSKDMIIRGGVNIYPQEIEATLRGHPAVLEAAVVGWPSREFNEEVAAFVIRKGEVDQASLTALCRQALASYKVPREIFFVDDLPRNSSGKIVKADLVSRLSPL